MKGSLLDQALAYQKREQLSVLSRSVLSSGLSRSEIIQQLLPNYVIQDKPRQFHDSTKPDKGKG